ncbi:pirin family protein [Halomonas denitrificans]|nr:pirin family protein [Halomonas denitrificans]
MQDDAPRPAGVDQVIVPRSSDIGGFEVARALPSRQRRSIGPFVFLDQMGRGHFAAGSGLDVRPHPHIGLSTLTWLFEGALVHRDSLGCEQRIEPGAVNLMTAGRGVVHSERSPDDLREAGTVLAGMQAWLALPQALEDCEPEFRHHSAAEVPEAEDAGWTASVVVGEAFGVRSPVVTPTQTVYVDLRLETGGRILIEPVTEERALYVYQGALRVDGRPGPAGRLLVLAPGARVELEADRAARVLLLGGEPLDGPRYLWWNFVSSSRDRIRAAQADWTEGRFPPVPGDPERIPLPDLPGP